MRFFRNWGINRPDTRLDRTNTFLDAFGRLRISEPQTLFDSKLSSSALPEYWDRVAFGTASNTWDRANACVHMAVATNNDYAIAQTFQRWNYLPGKSQLILATFKAPIAQGVTSRIGLFHGNYATPHTAHDGVYFQVADGVASVNIIKGTESAGIAATESAPQSQWNMDRLDGSGPSGMVADWTKAQILQIDFQWLGVGGVRFGFEVDSVMVYVHEFYHAGMVDSVYMHSGTQPVRYEIRSTGGAGTLDHICSSVSSEGGSYRTGITTSMDTNGTLISCPVSSIQMILAVRIDKDNPDVQAFIESVGALNTANNSIRWVILRNPTITGTPNWVQGPLDSLEVWRNAGANITMTGGLQLDSGYASRDTRQTNDIVSPTIGPGISINGTSDVFALGIEGIGGNATCSGKIGVRVLV